jgi:hypothetical protein
MARPNHDTDPTAPDPRLEAATTEPERITPARILAVAKVSDTEPGNFAPKKASTDPGVAPPAPPPAPKAATAQPLGLVVPTPGMRPADVSPPPSPVIPTPTPAKYDTIETLLDGIPGTRGERVKTTRETAGETAAAYHGQHTLRAPHETPPPEPSVIAADVAPDAPAEPGPKRAETLTARRRRGNEPTVVLPKTQGPRVVVALFSGVVVVLAIFLGLRVWVANEKVKAAAQNPALSQVIPGSVAFPPTNLPSVPPPPDLSELGAPQPPLTSPPPPPTTTFTSRATASPPAVPPTEGAPAARPSSSGPPPPGFDALKQHT